MEPLIHRGIDAKDESRCATCGHDLSARCSRCGQSFMCGEAGESCPVSGCPEMVIARRYRSQSDWDAAAEVRAGRSRGIAENPRAVSR